MLVLELDEVGLRRMTFNDDPVRGLKLAARLKPWIEGLDAAAFCVSSRTQGGADRTSKGRAGHVATKSRNSA